MSPVTPFTQNVTADDDHDAAQRDQAGRKRDQVADDRDAASDQRDRAGDRRDSAADRRDVLSTERDRRADQRDEAGDERDVAAAKRDRAAQQFEDSVGAEIPIDALRKLHHVRAEAASDRRVSADDRLLNAGDRRHSADERTSAGEDRSIASTDRQAGDSERGDAGEDRTAALADRDSSASDREVAHLDELTGAYRRGSGFLELEREVARSLRAHEPLSVAFVDVDDLKLVNDSLGHAAGDRLIRHVAEALRSRLRAYDLVVRYGGDEFICVMPGLTAAAATERLASLNRVLRSMSDSGSMSVGVAELRPDESGRDLVRRADQSLYRARRAGR